MLLLLDRQLGGVGYRVVSAGPGPNLRYQHVRWIDGRMLDVDVG